MVTLDTGGAGRRLLRSVRALVRRFAVSERADVACCGMTVAQAATLETLLAEPRLRLGDLGRRLGISASTLSRNLARLEETGLVAATRTTRTRARRGSRSPPRGVARPWSWPARRKRSRERCSSASLPPGGPRCSPA